MNDLTRQRVTDPARQERIEQIFRRGFEAQRRAFDPVRHLVGNPASWANGRTVYRPPESLWFAHALLHQGHEEDERTAARVIDAALASQERSPAHPHRGNFRWLIDDPEVVDLNAVQFMLRALLPLLIEHGDRLPAAVLERSREALRLALEEQERMAVAPTYTNIHIMALFSLLVGGEWLEDEHFLALGLERWDAWVRFTSGSGAPHEFNSPGYGVIDLSGLAAIQQYIRDPSVRLQARLLYERLWLHLALHFHRATGQHAGPHSRCYWGAMINGQSGLHALLWRETGRTFTPNEAAGAVPDVPASVELALTDHWLPGAARAWIEHQERALPYDVRETADRAAGQDLTTYFTSAYALGTASRTYTIGQDDFYIEHQANYCLLHYARPGQPCWGMMYSRYVVNDRHFGTLTAAPDRPPNAFYDQGNFAGVQMRNKAIALYALQPQHEEVFSLKTVIVFSQADLLEEVWLGGSRVDIGDLPQPVNLGDWLVIADGAALIGVRPLEPSCLGHGAPLLLERGPAGELWLTIYNYRGPAKRFWDYASLRGAFWRGNLRAGYVVEVAERTAFPSSAAFLAHLQQTTITDIVEADDTSPLVRIVTYHSGHDTLELRYDLWHTQPAGRRINDQAYASPALESPLAVHGERGTLHVGAATLRTNPQPCWLIAQEVDQVQRVWVAVNPEPRPTPVRLETPLGVLTATRWGAGRIEWRQGPNGRSCVVVDTLEPLLGLDVPQGVEVEMHPR